MVENIALFLASKQKRLQYWAERFHSETLPEQLRTGVNALLKQYAAVVTKAARSTDASEQETLLNEVTDIDRELNGIFESRRLLTSELGIAAITDSSGRGEGGGIPKAD